MELLLGILIGLLPLCLALGLLIGMLTARWWIHSRSLPQKPDLEHGTYTSMPRLSSCAIPEAFSSPLATAKLPAIRTCPEMPTEVTADVPAASIAGSDRLRAHSPTAHLGHLVRAASQVMDEWETKSVLHRLAMPEATSPLFPPSPSRAFLSSTPGPGSLLLQTHWASAPQGNDTFFGATGEGEVHTDEVDVLERLGCGAGGHVYTGQWRGAQVAVKYIKIATDDGESLGRAVREVIISRKMNHPNIVQTFSWTVLADVDEKYGLANSRRQQDGHVRRGGANSFCIPIDKLQAQVSDASSSVLECIPARWPASGGVLSAATPIAALEADADAVASLPASPSDRLRLSGHGAKRRRTSQDSNAEDPSTHASIESAPTITPRRDSQVSFNSEEGFGSPVKHKHGGVQSIFDLEGIRLDCNEALLAVVMEYCDLGSLHRALQRKAFLPSQKWPFRATFRALLRTAAEIAKAMEYLHGCNIIHGDLKPANVLLKTHKADRRGYVAKVADFGLSRHVEEGHQPENSNHGAALGGTLAYLAPEVLEGSPAGKPADVYAFGILMYEMLACACPYDGLMDGEVVAGVIEGVLRPEFESKAHEEEFEFVPEAYRELAQRCWAQDPEKRPHFAAISQSLCCIELEFRAQWHKWRREGGGEPSVSGRWRAAI